MDLLKPSDLAYVQDLLSKAAKQVEDSEACQSCDVKTLTDYALSVLKSLSCQSDMEGSVERDGETMPPEAPPSDGSQASLRHEQQQLAEVDTHVLDLHKKVLQKAAQVTELRAAVPALISQSVQGELEGLRPLVASIEHLTAAAPAQGSKPEDQAQPGLPAGDVGEELQAMLAGTLDRLPALRARLEQTVQRLARITAAVDAEQARSSPLKTVEKVLLERPADDTENMGDQLASSVDGSKATRRRLAKDLNTKLM